MSRLEQRYKEALSEIASRADRHEGRYASWESVLAWETLDRNPFPWCGKCQGYKHYGEHLEFVHVKGLYE